VDPSPIRILIADDHPVVRRGLKVLLGTEPGFEVVGEVSTGGEAVEAAAQLDPDVILMDLVMPGVDGAEATRRILAGDSEARVLVLTSFGSDNRLFPALQAGALGFMLKDATGDELVSAIRRVAQGQSSLSPEIARRLVREVAQEPSGNGPGEPLTPRETDVLRSLAHGLSNDEIADDLGISPATVRTHVSSILGKLGLTRRTQAVLYALRHGIVTLDEGDDQA
jgi:NarL family two-component system response regulator LiaR